MPRILALAEVNQQVIMSAMKMKAFIPEKPMMERGVREAEDDVMKLKHLAFRPPSAVPNDLTWYWAERVMAIMARERSGN